MPIKVNYQPDAAIAGEAANIAGLGQFAKERDQFALTQDQFAFSREKADRDHQLRVAQAMAQARQQQINSDRSAQAQRQNHELAQRNQMMNEQKAQMTYNLGQQQNQAGVYKNDQNNAFQLQKQRQEQVFGMEELGQRHENALGLQDNQGAIALGRQEQEQEWQDIGAAAETRFKNEVRHDEDIQSMLGGLDPNNMASKMGRTLYDKHSDTYRGIMDSKITPEPVREALLGQLKGKIQRDMADMKQKPAFNAQDMFKQGGAYVVDGPNGQKIMFMPKNMEMDINKIDPPKPPEPTFDHITDPFAKDIASQGRGALNKAVDDERRRDKQTQTDANNALGPDVPKKPYVELPYDKAMQNARDRYLKEQAGLASMGIGPPPANGEGVLEDKKTVTPEDMSGLMEEIGGVYGKLRQQGVDVDNIPSYEDGNTPVIRISGNKPLGETLANVNGWAIVMGPQGRKSVVFVQHNGDQTTVAAEPIAEEGDPQMPPQQQAPPMQQSIMKPGMQTAPQPIPNATPMDQEMQAMVAGGDEGGGEDWLGSPDDYLPPTVQDSVRETNNQTVATKMDSQASYDQGNKAQTKWAERSAGAFGQTVTDSLEPYVHGQTKLVPPGEAKNFARDESGGGYFWSVSQSGQLVPYQVLIMRNGDRKILKGYGQIQRNRH